MPRYVTYSDTASVGYDFKEGCYTVADAEIADFEENISFHVEEGWIPLTLQITPLLVDGNTVSLIYTQALYLPVERVEPEAF